MKRRQAYMIMAHHDIPLLQKLVTMLDIPENDIYIHFDKSNGDCVSYSIDENHW